MGRENDLTRKCLIANWTLETVMVLHMGHQIFGTGTRLTANHAGILHVHVESMSLQIGLI